MRMPILARYMTARPVTIERGSTLAAAERLMRVHQIRHLPVLAHGRLVGIIGAHDLHMLELVGRLDLETVRVEAVMVQDPFSLGETTPLDQVVDAMAERRLDAVVVTDLLGVRGIFTAVDACEALASVLRRAVA
jgi:acetoin utilization protein AcuB